MATLKLGSGRFGFRNVQLFKTDRYSLGIGSYGAVYRAKCDQLVCAAKVLHPILFQTRDPASRRIVQRFEQEIRFISDLHHPNIIQYLGSCSDPETGLPVLFMELMDESLTNFLECPSKRPSPLAFHLQVNIALDIAQALSHLHHHKLLHRDLSSNNVLLIGNSRAKVTDFGMATMLGVDPRLTPTYCPGTNSYMSPEALAEPPAYTAKLDIFSCGVVFIQLITRKFPDPGPRTRTVELNDPRLPSGTLLAVVPELKRRKDHIDLIPPSHPLLEVALECLKDKDDLRPTAVELCFRLTALKESPTYQDSLKNIHITDGITDQTTCARSHKQLKQQLREQESKVKELTHQILQLELHMPKDSQRDDDHRNDMIQVERDVLAQKDRQIQEKENELQQKDAVIQRQEMLLRQAREELNQKQEENRRLVRQLQSTSQDSEQVVAALQQSVEQKDVLLRGKEEQLQRRERWIQQLQKKDDGEDAALDFGHGNGEAIFGDTNLHHRRRDGAVGPLKQGQNHYRKSLDEDKAPRQVNGSPKNLLKLEWKDGPKAPSVICGESAVVSEGMAYFCEGVNNTKVIVYNTDTEQWTVLPECPKKYFSVAIVSGQLTAVGGKHTDRDTSSLLSITPKKGWLGFTRQQWVEVFPAMLHCHNNPAVTTTKSYLIVAGGWGPEGKTAAVEVLDTKTLCWFEVASLPYPLHQATVAHFQGRLYIGGGCTQSKTVRGGSMWTNSVVTCEESRLLTSHRTQNCWGVWKKVADLPVMMSSIVAVKDQLLALGGTVSGDDSDKVYQYHAESNSWNAISSMQTKRHQFYAVVLPRDQLMVVGGSTPDGLTDKVEIAHVVPSDQSRTLTL